MALMFIPEEDEGGCQLGPDTPMFQRIHDKENNQSSVGSLQILNSLEDSSSVDPSQTACPLPLAPSSPHSLCSSSSGSLSVLKERSAKPLNTTNSATSACSTTSVSSCESEMERLRRANYANEKIIMEMSNSLKQLQQKLSCY